MQNIPIKDFEIGQGQPLTLISGPCVIESEEHCLYCAEELKKITADLPVNLIFKASYDKANRLSLNSDRGVGIDEGMRILARVKNELNLPVTSDIHEPWQADKVKEILDIIQIPALLCRQTDLVVAAARTGKPVSIKKGQFMAPVNMKPIVDKVHNESNPNVILMERGTSFGYHRLVNDMTSIPIMKQMGCPVAFDASHSVQLPGAGTGETTGGLREHIPTVALAGLAAGANMLFIETHNNPAESKSDRGSIFPLSELKDLLKRLLKVYEAVN